MDRSMEQRRIVSVLMNRSFADYKVRCTVRCALMAATVALIAVTWLPLDLPAAVLLLLLSLGFLLPAHGWDLWPYSLQSSFLGYLFTYAVVYAWLVPDSIFARYVACMCVFHFLEFMVTAVTSLETLDRSSYLLDHSVAYWVAAVGSWLEFSVEYYLMPGMKIMWISYIGLGMVVFGEVFRKLAMVHAQGGFTHIVARHRRFDHALVTDGVYAMVRHPGYLGWYVWCIGTQVLLCNPVCALVYAVSAWFFFNDRIYDEERLLVRFFGQEYIHYQRSIWLGIPFVQGYDGD